MQGSNAGEANAGHPGKDGVPLMAAAFQSGTAPLRIERSTGGLAEGLGRRSVEPSLGPEDSARNSEISCGAAGQGQGHGLR